MMIINILILANLWAADPNMPSLTEPNDEGQVPCMVGCGKRPTPSQMLLDKTSGINNGSNEDADEGGL